MSETEKPVPATGPADPAGPEPRPERIMDEEKKFPRGLVIRLFAYLVAGHLFAAFLYLLFEMGGRG
ncbi:DUF6126 family protein [Streptomyces paludis]|uniref:Small hydrophobic protein n=1 Tax=Streptomyces paludis TaxID=2282738 RepID=A0A345HXF7_9ACTN|nr:DUF6126 family protein [Streptomyces paludis]AXG81381.1 hypothetical protein DVK44_30880 [Streptomyces paludis]